MGECESRHVEVNIKLYADSNMFITNSATFERMPQSDTLTRSTRSSRFYLLLSYDGQTAKCSFCSSFPVAEGTMNHGGVVGLLRLDGIPCGCAI